MGSFDEIIILDEDERLFTCYVTVEVEDKQKQFVPMSIFKKAFYKFLIRGATLHVVNEENKHSPLVVGRVINGEEEQLDGYRAFKALCQIYPHDKENTIFDETWNGIKSGKYKGVSIGGGKPIIMQKLKDNGSVVEELITVPLMEITIVERPANPFALISTVSMAKSAEKVYIKTEADAPKGVKISRGEKGGLFYITSPKKPKEEIENNNIEIKEKEEAEKTPINSEEQFIFDDSEAKTIHPSNYMSKPDNVDETKWNEAKEATKKQYSELSEEGEKFWAITNSIYQNMSKVETILDKTEVKKMEEYKEQTPSETVDLAQTLKALTEHMVASHDILMKIYGKICAEKEEMMKEEPKPSEKEEVKEEEKTKEETKPDKEEIEKAHHLEQEKEELEKTEPSEEGEKKEVTEEIDETSKEVNLAKSDVTETKKEDGKILISATPSVQNLEKSNEEPKTLWEAEVKRKLGKY